MSPSTGTTGQTGPEFSLALSDEQAEIQQWAHRFAREVIRPAAAEWDEREQTPWPVIHEAARVGLYGMEFLAQTFADPTGLTMPLVNEEIFWGDGGIGMALFGTNLAVAAIYGSGTPDQLVEWVPRCFGDVTDPKVAAFATTEPQAGSDVAAMRTRARYDEASREWVLSGQKCYITNGGIADVHVVTAVVDPQLGARGQAAFVVPGATKGFQAGPRLHKLGLRASHTADLFLDAVRVPAGNVLGGKERLDERLARAREGQQGRTQAAMRTFELSRPTVGAQALGIARAAYEYARDYAADRVQFGRPIIENQGVAFQLADMAVEIDAARLLVWRAAWMGKTNRPFAQAEGSMSKLKASEVAVDVTGRAVQLLGGAGYVADHPVQRWYRDAKIYPIFEGTSEIQRLVIARAISGARLR